MFQLDYLNTCPAEAFVAASRRIFSSIRLGLPKRRSASSSFPAVAALHDAMMAGRPGCPAESQLTFVAGHPELGSKLGRAPVLTAASRRRNRVHLGLDRLSDQEFDRFTRLNKALPGAIRLPFIICVRRHTRDLILRNFERRACERPGDGIPPMPSTRSV